MSSTARAMDLRVESDALLSKCGRYRYWLTRKWGEGMRVCWVMLNPSTADASQDDPTIRRCIAFSKSWGFGSLVVVNLWAARATNPKELLTLGDPVGPDNAGAMELAINGCALMVAAWGTFAQRMIGKGYDRLRPESAAHYALVPACCLGFTKAGDPRHPLYVKGDQPLVPFAKDDVLSERAAHDFSTPLLTRPLIPAETTGDDPR